MAQTEDIEYEIAKDTILSFVASVQIGQNDIIKIGDWIEVPEFGADGDVVEFAPLSNVPVIFPSGGGAIMSFPIKVGDPVWIQCSSASFNKFKESYQTNASDDMRRRHSINDAVAFPCIYPKDIRLGVNNENVEIIFNSLNEDRSINEFLSGIKMLPDGSLNITTKK